MAGLERILAAARQARTRLIVTDGVFSMDGDVAPLGAICDLADRYDALVAVDDSHATGFFGATGRGTPEYCGVAGRIDIITSTLGKALGSASGGFAASRHEVVALLRQRSRPYLFSNLLPPAIVPIMLGDARLAHPMAADLLAEGISVVGFSYPVVPKDAARIRVQISAAHEPVYLEQAVAAFVRVGRAHKVI